MENNQPSQAPASDSDQDKSSDLSELKSLIAARRAEFAKLKPADKASPIGGVVEAVANRAVELSRQRPPELTPEQIELRAMRRAQHEASKERYQREAAWRRFVGDKMAAYETCTIQSYNANSSQQSAAVAAMLEYAETVTERVDAGEGILFYGPPGTGKDHLAIGVIRVAVLEHGRTALRINGQDWFGDLRDMIDSERREQDEISRLTSPDLLLISDPLPPIGALTQHQSTMLYRVVCKRYEMLRPTIVTVNVANGAEGELRMGTVVWDRLKDRAWVVPCNWESHRKPSRIIGAPR